MTYKKFTLLDTNTIYLLAGLEVNEGVDIDNLKKYVKDNECVINSDVLFEIINCQDNVKANELLQVLIDYDINCHFLTVKKDVFEEIVLPELRDTSRRNKAYLKIGADVVKEAANMLTMIFCLYIDIIRIIILENYKYGETEDKIYFKKVFKGERLRIKKHINKIFNDNLLELLHQKKYHGKYLKPMILNTLKNVMTYYYELIKVTKLSAEQKYKTCYFHVAKKYKQFTTLLLKDALRDNVEVPNCQNNPLFLLYEYAKQNKISLRDLKGGIKDIINNRMVLPSDRVNELEKEWSDYIINKLFIESGNIEINDFIDHEVLSWFNYSSKYDNLITFDKNMRKILNSVTDNVKITKNNKFLNKFKIDKKNHENPNENNK